MNGIPGLPCAKSLFRSLVHRQSWWLSSFGEKREPFRPAVYGKCRALEPHDRKQTESLVQLANGS